jgi:CheY-like chemotaxis protein
LNGLGLEVEIVENGSKCIEYLLDSKDKEKGEEEEFAMVILNSHLPDTNGIELKKTIIEKISKSKNCNYYNLSFN